MKKGCFDLNKHQNQNYDKKTRVRWSIKECLPLCPHGFKIELGILSKQITQVTTEAA